jgi:Zn-dependent membrane protease YugP
MANAIDIGGSRMFIFDPMYLLIVGPALILGIVAQVMVSRAYNRYSRVRNARGVTGLQAAQHLLMYNHMGEVQLEGTPGQLSDHYDPRNNKLRLSAGVARTPSVAALGIVAHEVGHAQQVYAGYAPMSWRSAIVPVANIGSMAGPWLVLLGVLFQWSGLAWAGIVLFSTAALFYLVTLPVELDASRRGLALLRDSGLVVPEELDGARKVLRAASWTYVAALLTSVLQLFYFASLVGGGRRRS